MLKALVLGGGGFIGGHLVKHLKSKGYWVQAVDLKENPFSKSADEFIIGDLSVPEFVDKIILNVNDEFDHIYQLAADMGGAGYIFTGENDANVMHNSAIINLNVLNSILKKYSPHNYPKVFYSSSACIYPENLQMDSNNPGLKESSAYPANPDSEYGWEKLFSERLYLAYFRNFGIPVRVARFHNIYGPEGTWQGGKEKAPAAICRKVAMAEEGGSIEIWGDGKQTRSFLYIDDCIEAVLKFMNSDFIGPLNIGSEELISINNMAKMVANIAKKEINIINIEGPRGVVGRNSNNDLIRSILKWDYKIALKDGLSRTYEWIKQQVSYNS